MKNHLFTLTAAAALFTMPALAQDAPEGAPSPNEIVNAAAPEEWVEIAAEDLLVMTLAPDAGGNERKVVIQLMPAPFSQGWVENIRTLARAEWYDGISVNRVQDNYVVQWGDPGHDNPESGEVETKPLPEGLNVMGEAEYSAQNILSARDSRGRARIDSSLSASMMNNAMTAANGGIRQPQVDFSSSESEGSSISIETPRMGDNYAPLASLVLGWPIASNLGGDEAGATKFWPVHCYGMVGVGRNYSPDTGSGAELYTVIGHAPRHLDRNIAVVGRIISGMEHLSSMTRGTGALGFYTEEEAHLRTPILSIRVASDLPENDPPSSSEAVGQRTAPSSSEAVGQQKRPQFEYLTTEGETFARYAEARANRRDPFFIVPAGGADICNIPVPVRAFEYADEE